ncbi:Lamin-L(II) [Bienertia sinuspersici]
MWLKGCGLMKQDPSLSASDSRQSFDSTEASSGNDMFSPQDNMFGPVNNVIGRQDSAESRHGGASHSYCATDDDNRSNHSSVHSRAAEPLTSFVFQQELNPNDLSLSPSKTASSKGLLEAAEVTIEELRAEAKMWERNAKKLTVDLEVLRKEMSEQSRRQETLGMELLASQQECNGLQQEVNHLKSLLEESAKKENATTYLRHETKDMDETENKMEEEIRFLQESNANLAEQLRKTQESNVELLSILQELEGIIESQKMEIDNLSSLKLMLQESESQCLPTKAQSAKDSSMESTKVLQSEPDTDEQFPVGIHNIKLQLQQLQETQKELECTVQLLEKSVEEKDGELERERVFRTQALSEIESKWRLQLAAKEEEITNMEAKLSEIVKDQGNKTLEIETGDVTDLAKVFNVCRRMVEYLGDCSELTEENLQLLLKVKEPKDILFPPDVLGSCGSHDDHSPCTYGTEVSQLRGQLEELQRKLRSKETLVKHAETSAQSQVQYPDLESKCGELEIQLQTYKEKVVHLEDELRMYCVQLEEQQIEACALQQRIEQYEANETTGAQWQLLLPNVNVACSNHNYLSHILFDLRKLLDHALKLTRRNIHSLNTSVDCSSVCCFHDLELKCNESLTFEEQLYVILEFLSKSNKCFEEELNRCKEMIKYANEDSPEADSLKGYEICISNQEPARSDEVTQHSPGKEFAAESSETKALKSDNSRTEDDNEMLRKQLHTLEDHIASVRDENLVLQGKIQGLEREKSSISEHLEELEKENMMLSSSVESHISANKVLERMSSELGKGKEDLEQQLSDLEKDNAQLSERISALEAHLRYLTNEKETCLLELRCSESQSMNLRDEIRRLEIEMEAQKVEVKQKEQDMYNRWLKAQEECEYLKKANPKLESTAGNLIEECTSLQKYNGELKRQNMELHARCSILECKLRDSQAKAAECSEKTEALEAEFLILVEEVSIKAKILNSELDSLVTEDNQHREKVMQENISLNNMYMEKVIEAENYQRELVHLIDQISVAPNDPETVASEAMHEVSVLRAEKAKLELSLEELTDKYALSQSRLKILEAETESKVKQLTGELDALRKSQAVLVANHENLLVSLERLESSEEKHKSIINRLEIDLKASEYRKLQLATEISSLKEQLQRSNCIQAEVLDLKASLSVSNSEYERVKTSFDLLSGDHEKLKTEKDTLVQKVCHMQKSLLELEYCQHSKVALEEKILRLEGDLAAREALCSQDAELKFELSKIKRINNELQRKIKHLEHDLEQLQLQNQAMCDQMKSVGKPADTDDECIAAVSSTRDEKQLLHIPDVPNSDYQSAIQSLENELAEALEANEMYKDQLRRLLSEQDCLETPMISGNDNELNVKKHGINMLSMELELRDLRDRYLQMSLKYAEVEAQREELVLKLKSTNNRRGWFS